MRQVIITLFTASIISFSFGQKSMYFDGKTNYIVFENDTRFNNSEDITIETWFKACDVSGYNPIINKHFCRAAQSSFHLGVRDGHLDLVWDEDGNCGSTNSYKTREPLIEINEWYHIAVIHTRDSVFFYVNNEKVDGYLASGSYSRIYKSNSPIMIGAYKTIDGELTRFWSGLIKNIAMYNTALNKDSIDNHYNNGVNANNPNLILWLDMEESVQFSPTTSIHNLAAFNLDIIGLPYELNEHSLIADNDSVCSKSIITETIRLVEKATITAFPTPFSDNLYLDFAPIGKIVHFTFLNNLGIEIKRGTYNPMQKTPIETTDLEKGVYQIKLELEDGSLLTMLRAVKM